MNEITGRTQVGWRFWFWWVAASTAGFGVGFAAGFTPRGPEGFEDVLIGLALAVLGIFMIGAGVGIAQWLVL